MGVSLEEDSPQSDLAVTAASANILISPYERPYVRGIQLSPTQIPNPSALLGNKCVLLEVADLGVICYSAIAN